MRWMLVEGFMHSCGSWVDKLRWSVWEDGCRFERSEIFKKFSVNFNYMTPSVEKKKCITVFIWYFVFIDSHY